MFKIFQKNHVEDIAHFENLLNTFISTKDLRYIPKIYWVLSLQNDKIKIKIFKEITKVLKDIKSTEYLNLDSLMREELSWEYYSKNSREINFEKLYIKELTEEEKVIILGLTTFHPNGYLREAALDSLVKLNHPASIPYIIIRNADWVTSINIKAKLRLNEMISKENFNDILLYISLINKMKKLLRFNYEEIINKIDSLYRISDFSRELKESIQSKDEYLREYTKINLINYYNKDLNGIIKLISNEKKTSIRIRLVYRLVEVLNVDELLKVKDELLKDKNPKIITKVIDKLYYNNYFKNPDNLIKFALDKNSSLRETARFYMSKLGYNDFLSLYRNNVSLKGGILGFSEIATLNEFQELKNILSMNKGKVAKKVLNALCSINFDACKDEVIKWLDNENIQLSKTARKILQNKEYNFNYDEIYNIYKKTEYENVETNCILILCNCSKWIRLSYIIEFCASDNYEHKKIGEEKLKNWIYNFNRSLVKSSNYEKKSLTQSLMTYGGKINEKLFVELQSYI